MKYTVEFIASLEIEVEADNENEAEEKAQEILDMREFCIDEIKTFTTEERKLKDDEPEWGETEFDENGCPVDCPCLELYPDCYCKHITG